MDLVLTVHNAHVEGCGTPPNLDTQTLKYVSLYTNGHGEQLVYVINEAGKTLLYHGDTNWERPYPVNNGRAALVLDEDERLWLDLCWRTSAWIRTPRVRRAAARPAV